MRKFPQVVVLCPGAPREKDTQYLRATLGFGDIWHGCRVPDSAPTEVVDRYLVGLGDGPAPVNWELLGSYLAYLDNETNRR